MLKSITFEVIGDQRLHCESCERRVESLLKGVQGVRQVRADASLQRIAVLFETSELEESAILDRLRLLGYTTKEAIRPQRPSGEMNRMRENNASD